MIYNHINQIMFKYVTLFALVLLASASLQVYSPECAVSRFPKLIEYTLSNFGYIPYGEILIGQIKVPNKELLCDIEGESILNNRDPNTRIILLVKRGTCKFTEKVINAQNLGADLVIIYDDQKGNTPSVIMKNDGHGHLAEIPSLFISNDDGVNLKATSKDCPNYPVVKLKFDIDQADVSNVILWLDANNRQSFILAREFYKNDYYKVLQDKINLQIRQDSELLSFRVDNYCSDEKYCEKKNCVGTVFKEKYCRNVEKKDDEDVNSINGVVIIEQQLREHFLWELLPKENKMQWWKYMTKFDHDDCIDRPDVKDCSKTAMEDIGISSKIIQQVQNSVEQAKANVTEDKPSILRTNAFEANELGIYFYPEATINSRNFYGLFKASQVFEMICQSLLSPPKQCIAFIKNKDNLVTVDESAGLWKTVLLVLFLMTLGFVVALFIYTKLIRKEVDQQLSVQVNKMVENYVSLAEKKKSSGTGNSYSKFDS